jgi:hypothetical protein
MMVIHNKIEIEHELRRLIVSKKLAEISVTLINTKEAKNINIYLTQEEADEVHKALGRFVEALKPKYMMTTFTDSPRCIIRDRETGKKIAEFYEHNLAIKVMKMMEDDK